LIEQNHSIQHAIHKYQVRTLPMNMLKKGCDTKEQVQSTFNVHKTQVAMTLINIWISFADFFDLPVLSGTITKVASS
jgi:hypothetical protein